MARKNIMVTRTVKTTVCTTLIVKADKTTENRQISIPGEMDANTALAYLQKNPSITAPDFPAYVFAVAVQEDLYGMTLDCFIKNSIKLPPRSGSQEEIEELEEVDA